MIETEATAEAETSEVAAVVEDAAGDVDVVAVEVPIKKIKIQYCERIRNTYF